LNLLESGIAEDLGLKEKIYDYMRGFLQIFAEKSRLKHWLKPMPHDFSFTYFALLVSVVWHVPLGRAYSRIL